MKKHFKTRWEDHLKRVTARVLIAVLTVTTCMQGLVFPAHAESYGKNGIVRENMTSWQIVDDMGLGYNIGNTFDSIGSWITIDDPWEYQRAWNNDTVSKHFIQKVHQAGFKTIRLPVSWAKWIDGNNQIDPGYMSAVQTVVDWCMEEDMYVILNIHHDSGAADNSWVRNIVTDFDSTSRKYAAVWNQIATNFAGYGDHLIFEGMNEVEFPAASSKSRQYELLNHLNQLFVDTVRATGGNNAGRHLLIPGFNTDIKQTCDRRYHMPEDPAGRCILSIHYYSPSPFAVAEHNVDWCEPVTTWGSEEDIAAVREHFDMLANNFLGKGVPVIIGEYGVLTEDNKEKQSIRDYVKKVPEIIMEYGMCPVLWDTSNAGDMKFIERNSGEFYDAQIRANYAELAQKKASGQIARKDLSITNYKEVQLPISPGGWVSLASYDPSKILGVKFSLICSSDWDSYGGGGIWIDGYDNTPQYQFNSVFDEVTYMFTEEERGRLGDRLGIFLWWTDESKGGNRVSDLAFENGRVTILYAEGENVNTAGPYTNSGGGGGGGGGNGRPNHGTNPGGSGNQYGEREVKAYPYSLDGLNKDGYSCTVNIKELYDGFELGDKIRLTIYPLTDDWASGAIEIPGLEDNGFGGNKQEFVFIPAQNTMVVKLWVTGNKRSYFRFAMRCEVIEKGNQDPILVKNGEELSYTWDDLMKIAGVSGDRNKNQKLKVTFAVENPEGLPVKDVSVHMYKANGVSFSSTLGSEENDNTAGASISGAPRKQDVAVNLKNSSGSDILIKGIYVEVLEEEDDPNVLQKMQGGITNFSREAMTVQNYDGSEPEGIKIYFTTEDKDFKAEKFGGKLFVNDMGWDDGMEGKDWTVKNDDGGMYIFIPKEKYEASANKVWFNLWELQDGFTITKVIVIEQEEENPFSPVLVKAGESVDYPLKDLLEQAGIASGGMARITVKVRRLDAAATATAEVSLTDRKGYVLSAMSSGTTAWHTPDPILTAVVNQEDVLKISAAQSEDVAGDFEIENITVEPVTADILTEIGSMGSVALPQAVIDEAKVAAVTGERAGVKVYYSFSGDDIKNSGIALKVNGTELACADWETGSDGEGAYIWADCGNLRDLGLSMSWWDENPAPSLAVKKLVVVKTAEQKEEFSSFTMNAGEVRDYALKDLLEQSGIASGSLAKITVKVRRFEGEGTAMAEVSLSSQDGYVLSAMSSGTTAWHTPDPVLTAVVSTEDILKIEAVQSEDVTGKFEVEEITIEPADDSALAKIGSMGSVAFPQAVIDQAVEAAVTGERAGVKVYYSFSGDDIKNSGIALKVNGAEFACADWETDSDADGDFIWADCGSLSSFGLLMSWWDENPAPSLTIKKLVAVKKEAGEDPGETDNIVKGETAEINLAKYDTEGVLGSNPVRMEITFTAEAGYKGEVELKDASHSGVTIVGEFSNDNGGECQAVVIGNPQNNKVTVKLSDDASAESCIIKDIQIIEEALDSGSLAGLSADWTGKVIFSGEAIEDQTDGEETCALKIYLSEEVTLTDGSVAGWWNDGWRQKGFDELITGNDEEGYYICFEDCGGPSNGVGEVNLNHYGNWSNADWKVEVKKVVLVSQVAGNHLLPAVEEAVKLGKNLFRLPVMNVPVGMEYTVSDSMKEENGGQKGILRIATSADWKEYEESAEARATSSNTAFDGWKAVTKKLPVEPESQREYEFAPAERNAIGRMIEWAKKEDSEDFPVLYFDLDAVGYWIEQMILIFDPEDILETDGFGYDIDLD